jgi:hypothetical protein
VKTLKEKMDSIRAALDADVTGVDIDSLVEKGKALAQLIGLSAECKAEAKAKLEKARLHALLIHDTKKRTPTIIMKYVEADCANEISDFEYADRLNAGITHQLDYYRSVISLHKTELENSLK